MNETPLVTIVIPVYNGTNFMREAIDSALAQTYPNVEILVVNDGSTDDGATERTALSYGDRIRYLAKENGGVSSALNLAVSEAKGSYISWLSHDDLYYPEKIEREVVFLRRILKEEPGLDGDRVVIHCATESIDRNGRVLKRPSYRGVDEKEQNLKVILDNVYRYRLSGCSFLIPKAAFADIGGFREDIRTVSDVEYWYRLLFHDYRFFCLTDEILVRNRSHGKQVGKVRAELFERELNELHISIADRLMERPEYNTAETLERYYFGLVVREMKQAAAYTKLHGLKNRISPVRYHIVLPVKACAWKLKGLMIDVARRVYRRLLVR